jgi:hypothetical protein
MPAELPLRDIHLPAPIGWWPPAPGWWLVAFGIPALLLLSFWLWRWWRRLTPNKLALRELDRISHSAEPTHEKLRQLAILLRRTCLSVYPREDVASLTGEAWLEFLDRPLQHQGFSAGIGRCLLDGPYRRDADIDLDALIRQCREWIQRLPKPGSAAATRHLRVDEPAQPAPVAIEAPPKPMQNDDPRRFARRPSPSDEASQ